MGVAIVAIKAFDSAEATLAGIETTHMIRKGQIHASGFTAFHQFLALAAYLCPGDARTQILTTLEIETLVEVVQRLRALSQGL